jgi:hypothetical protein
MAVSAIPIGLFFGKSTPAILGTSGSPLSWGYYQLPLSLFMFWIFTNNTHNTLAFNYLALLTHFFY